MHYKHSLPGSIKELDTRRGLITAYASAFGVEDSDGDIIEKGAYAKTIREHGPSGTGRVKVLYMHRFDEPIGKVLSLEEDERGLLVQFQLLKTARAQDALKLYEADLLEHSVGIDVLQRRSSDRRRISEVRLWEISPVTWGANPNTPTVSVKTVDSEARWLRLLNERLDEKLAEQRLRDALSDLFAAHH